LNAEDKIKNSIIGMLPNDSKHDSIFQFEPVILFDFKNNCPSTRNLSSLRDEIYLITIHLSFFILFYDHTLREKLTLLPRKEKVKDNERSVTTKEECQNEYHHNCYKQLVFTNKFFKF
jgi:hypothetical protein